MQKIIMRDFLGIGVKYLIGNLGFLVSFEVVFYI